MLVDIWACEMLEALYKWFCNRTIVKWSKGKFKSFTAFFRHDAKGHTLLWLLAFMILGLALDNSTGIIQDNARLSVFVGMLIGIVLGHLFW